ncbi:MAG TPA: hypothetical protein VGF57_13400 [Roseiarcus sp.]|jgi:hypothetical protein
MAILIFVLSLVLLIAGAASAYQSLDLLPDGLGVLYALAGAVAVAAAVVTFAIGVMIRRIDALTKLVLQSAPAAIQDAPPASEPAPAGEALPAPVAVEAEAAESVDGPLQAEDESPININRAGHLPSLDAIETVLETPETPPSMIGSYSSAGANYKIFADGSIEAETSEGTFRFASMSDFKRHLVDAKARTPSATE